MATTATEEMNKVYNNTAAAALNTWHMAVGPTGEDAKCKDVLITKVGNGFIVKVGCVQLVANTWKEVSQGLDLYWKDPAKAEKKYCK